MAWYNHFAEIKNKRIVFRELEIGDLFSWRDRPFKLHWKRIGTLEIENIKTGEKKTLFSDGGQVYVKPPKRSQEK